MSYSRHRIWNAKDCRLNRWKDKMCKRGYRDASFLSFLWKSLSIALRRGGDSGDVMLDSYRLKVCGALFGCSKRDDPRLIVRLGAPSTWEPTSSPFLGHDAAGSTAPSSIGCEGYWWSESSFRAAAVANVRGRRAGCICGTPNLTQSDCGASTQSRKHLLECPSCLNTCTEEEFNAATNSAIKVVTYYSKAMKL